MNKWSKEKLSNLADITSSKRIFVSDYQPYGIPFFRGKEITEKAQGNHAVSTQLFISEEKFCEIEKRFGVPHSGDILVSAVGTLGSIYRVRDNERFYFKDGNLLWFRNFSSYIDSAFLSIWLKSNKTQQLLQTIAIGTTQKALTIINLKNLEIPLPPIHEQRAIAYIIGSLDDKIELNRQMNETLEAMARALFKDWFVDFGPVRAKMAGQEPPGLATDVAALFPDALDDQGKPVGWKMSQIGDEVRVVGGATPNTKEVLFWDGGTNYWVTPKDLSKLTSPVLLSSERKITDAGLAQISSRLLPIGTVLLSSRAPIGYLAITEVRTAINQGFIALICEQELPNLYILFWCKENMESIIGNANGSTFQEISKTNFRPLPILVPSREIVWKFIHLVEPVFRKIVANLQEMKSLEQLRDLLIPRLLSGELRVKDFQQIIEDTL